MVHASPRPKTLTPTLSQPPPILPGEGALAEARQVRAPSPGGRAGGWERVGVRVRAAKPPGSAAIVQSPPMYRLLPLLLAVALSLPAEAPRPVSEPAVALRNLGLAQLEN